MKYSKPEIKKVVVSVKVDSNADDKRSCEGGHCVLALKYGH